MNDMRQPVRIETVVVGGGQAGLAVGYHLARADRLFVILDANERIGDAWRNRWDSLRLFTPARYNGLPGMPFPAPRHSFPTKDDMADYLESYAAHFALPVHTGTKVERLAKHGGRFMVTAGDHQFDAEQVVVAMANWQRPRIPSFAQELHPNTVHLHAGEYRNPSDLQEGPVLVVGVGSSGAEIALEVAQSHQTWLSGRDTGLVPFNIDGAAARILFLPLILRFLFHRVLTVGTPIGRKARQRVLSHAMPRLRVKPEALAAAGIERVDRTVGVRDGLPLLADGRVLDVANVIWCTGFDPDFSWINLPVFGPDGEPIHDRGVVASTPGLYFVGLLFLYAPSSSMVHGVGRDAEHIVRTIVSRRQVAQPTAKGRRESPPGARDTSKAMATK